MPFFPSFWGVPVRETFMIFGAADFRAETRAQTLDRGVPSHNRWRLSPRPSQRRHASDESRGPKTRFPGRRSMDLAAPHRFNQLAPLGFEGRLPFRREATCCASSLRRNRLILRREASASKGGHLRRVLPSKKQADSSKGGFRFEGRLPLRREASASKGGHLRRVLPSNESASLRAGRRDDPHPLNRSYRGVQWESPGRRWNRYNRFANGGFASALYGGWTDTWRGPSAQLSPPLQHLPIRSLAHGPKWEGAIRNSRFTRSVSGEVSRRIARVRFG
jgi:hypothetical protein